MKFYPMWAAEAAVWEFGARKYSRGQWMKLWGDETVNLVKASAMRHLTYMLDGQTHDEESGLDHCGHVLCNMTMLIRYAGHLGGFTFPAPTDSVPVSPPDLDKAERKNSGKPDLSFLTADTLAFDVREDSYSSPSALPIDAAILVLAKVQPGDEPMVIAQAASSVRFYMRQILNGE